MLDIQSKTTMHARNQETMIHGGKKNQLIKTNP